MKKPVFYGKPILQVDAQFNLTGKEMAHAHVLRLEPGSVVEVMDGVGHVATCEIVAMSKRTLTLKVKSFTDIARPRRRAIVALAVSKAIRRGYFMEKASELGASEVWLWRAERSVDEVTDKMLAACGNQIISGAKQSRNPWFPTLCNVKDALGIIAAANERGVATRVLPWEEQEPEVMISEAELGEAGDSLYVIGPEGGLTDIEVDTFREAGFAVVSLGSRVLRCETAGLLCLGLHMWAAQTALRKEGQNCGQACAAEAS